MTLYLIGLGLDWLDLSQKALEVLSRCDEVYLETYTSVASYSVQKLARFLGKKIVSLDRKGVEEKKPFLKSAAIKEVALLVYGDPLTATTHIDLLQECKKKKVKCEVIHAPSVLTAVAETGLQLYKFGKVASIPFWTQNHRPESFFDILEQNKKINAHTLFLLDLQPERDNFLTIKGAMDRLISISKQRRRSLVFNEKIKCIGCARLGTPSAKIIYGPASKVATAKYGAPPYCLIVPASLHFKEEEFLNKSRTK